MAQGATQDRGAAAVDAARGRFAGFAHQGQSPQARAGLMGKLHGLGVLQACSSGKHPHHFRDDLTGLAHHDGVAVVKIELQPACRRCEGWP